MAAVNWRRVAEVLAARLVNYAECPTHHVDRPDPDCPFCDDRAAYRTYLSAGGRDFTPSFPGTPVPIEELASSDRFVIGDG